jgi:hypothetical protein
MPAAVEACSRQRENPPSPALDLVRPLGALPAVFGRQLVSGRAAGKFSGHVGVITLWARSERWRKCFGT